MLSASDIRRQARESLGNSLFTKQFLYAILVYVIVGAIIGIAATTFVGALIVGGPLTVGFCYYMLRLVRSGEELEDIASIFNGFKFGMASNVVSFLLRMLYVFLWSLLFMIPGIVKSYSYAMTDYILADHPEYTATQAITESRRMMDGNKMRLFILDLSFIGWYIVSMLTMGIGFIWLFPYMMTARTHFYNEICGYTPVVNEAEEAADASDDDHFKSTEW